MSGAVSAAAALLIQDAVARGMVVAEHVDIEGLLSDLRNEGEHYLGRFSDPDDPEAGDGPDPGADLVGA